MLELDRMTPTCERCDEPLDEVACQLVVTTEAGQRRAYECACGAVTVTVARTE